VDLFIGLKYDEIDIGYSWWIILKKEFDILLIEINALINIILYTPKGNHIKSEHAGNECNNFYNIDQ